MQEMETKFEFQLEQEKAKIQEVIKKAKEREKLEFDLCDLDDIVGGIDIAEKENIQKAYEVIGS